MTEYDLGKVVGDDGEAGNGIASITKTGTSGLVDTYTITYDDGTTTTFTVTNGSDASVTIDSALSSSSTNPVQNKVIKGALDNKADSSDVPTKTSDLTNDSGFLTSLPSHNHDDRYYTESEVDTLLDDKLDVSDAFSGSYNDLSNKPSIPSATSDLTNDSGFITSSSLPTKTSDLTNDGDGTNAFLTQHQSLSNYIQKSSTSGLVKNDGTIDTSAYITSSALSNYVQMSSTTGLLKNDGSVDTNSYLTSSAISGMLTSSDIADNLTTNDSTKVLSAKQGKVLNDLIGSAIAYINQ